MWTSDITHLWADEGWLYLAIVLDLFNREVVGWPLKPRMTADIATGGWTDTPLRSRQPVRQLRIPSQTEGIRHDLLDGPQGKLLGYAPTESCFGSFKNERVYGERFETRDKAIAMTLEYVEVFYNRRRLHLTLGYKSPMQFLSGWLIAQQQEKLAA